MFKPLIGRPSSIVDFGVQHIEAHLPEYLGPWFMGLVGFTFTLGVLTSQTTKYFATFGYESLRMFMLVSICFILILAQWIVMVYGCWNWFVVHSGNLRTFAQIPWEATALTLITWFTVFVSQLFFAHRCYTLYGRNKLLFGVLILSMLANLAIFTFLSVVITIDPFNMAWLEHISIPGLVVNLFTDISITSLTLWKLGRRDGQTWSPERHGRLRRIRNVTIEAAVAPAICAILYASFFLAVGRKNLVYHFFALMTPGVYVYSLMFTLNSRDKIKKSIPAPTGDEEATGTGFQFANSKCQAVLQDSEKATVRFSATSEQASIGVLGERRLRRVSVESDLQSSSDRSDV